MKIYKSCTAGITDEQLELQHKTGTRVFTSYERLITKSLTDWIKLRDNERIKGMIIDHDGITCILETKI